MSKTANDRDGFTSVKPAGLLDKVKTLKEEGCRFYHMFADESDNGFDIVYIFAGENNMENFKVHIDKNEPDVYKRQVCPGVVMTESPGYISVSPLKKRHWK